VKPIVVIDDEPALRRLIAAGLATKGFTTLEAADGAAGLALCQERLPALVLCDLSMPILDGFETLKQLRADPRTSTIPVILMTGTHDGAGMRRGMELGADDFLLKPFRITDVVHAVESRLARQLALETRATRQLQARSQTLGTTLSHELRTPLNIILGYASLLVEEGGALSPAEIVEMAQGILTAGERLHRLVERQLALAELELWAVDPGRAATVEANRLDDAAALAGETASQVASKLSRTGDLTVDVKSAPARISAAHLERVVSELVENAFKFSAPGKPVRVTAGGDDAGFRIRVSDEGSGMTLEQIADVGAYVQFGRRHHEQQGLGLGLALARKTVELWGGSLGLSPNPGGGLTASVLLKP